MWQRLPAFSVEQTINDEIVGVAHRQRLTRFDGKIFRFRLLRQLLLAAQNHIDRKTLTRIAVLKINVLGNFAQPHVVAGFERDLRQPVEFVALGKIARDRKRRRGELCAPAGRNNRLPANVFQIAHKREPMFCSRDHAFHHKHAFGLALPQKIAFDFRFAHERTRLLAQVDLVCAHHRARKCNREFCARRDLAFARVDHHAARVRVGIRFFLARRRMEVCQADARGKENDDDLFHSFVGYNSRMRFRSASALSIWPMRRSQFSRARSASSVSPSFSERVCDSIAAGKSARFASSTPRWYQAAPSFGFNSVALTAWISASFELSNASRSCAASKCAAADLSSIASAARASASASATWRSSRNVFARAASGSDLPGFCRIDASSSPSSCNAFSLTCRVPAVRASAGLTCNFAASSSRLTSRSASPVWMRARIDAGSSFIACSQSSSASSGRSPSVNNRARSSKSPASFGDFAICASSALISGRKRSSRSNCGSHSFTCALVLSIVFAFAMSA